LSPYVRRLPKHGLPEWALCAATGMVREAFHKMRSSMAPGMQGFLLQQLERRMKSLAGGPRRLPTHHHPGVLARRRVGEDGGHAPALDPTSCLILPRIV
jgi:hypothetical protein